MDRVLNLLGFLRSTAASQLEGLTDEQLVSIPERLGNNILWNIGHVLYYDCMFTYGVCGKDLPIPADYGSLFKNGSSPSEWPSAPDAQSVIKEYLAMPERIAKEYAAGAFNEFKPMEVKPLGERLKFESLPEVVAFQCAHAGMHMGRIGAIKKLIL